MGLVLPNPSDPDFLDTYLTSHRHLPGRDPYSNPRAKHPRRPFGWSQWKSQTRHERLSHLGPEGSASPLPPPRPHHVTLYNANVARHRQPRSPSARSYPCHNPSAAHAPSYYPCEITEGHLVARSNLPLPGEYNYQLQCRRPPSLTREDAFRDARTSRKRSSPSQSQSDSDSLGLGLYADDEELYRLGLLYDNEHERGEGFSLDKIVHESEDLWAVNLRPAKRGRKSKSHHQHQHNHQNGNLNLNGNGEGKGFCTLELALSFAALGEDDALAAWLLQPGEDEKVMTQEEERTREVVVRREERGDLMVVYELDEACDQKEDEDDEETQPQGEEEEEEEEGCVMEAESEQEDEDWAFLDQYALPSTRKNNGSDATTDKTETETDANVDDNEHDNDNTWIMLCG